ncbi:MAG: hypothetical protein VSS75_020210 [Candidatus Parabeggiatoa sp.]|nr:hypothetical protein [Candidatus Parabeggiatoa sp.]
MQNSNWLEKWKDRLPSRWLAKLKEGQPEDWLEKLKECLPQEWLDTWALDQLEDCQPDEGLEYCLKLLKSETRDEIHDLCNDSAKYIKLKSDLDKKYKDDWVESTITGRAQKHNPFFRKEIKNETDEYGDPKKSDWKTRRLPKSSKRWDSEEESHGRNQPFLSWEDYLHSAIMLLLDGIRIWNCPKDGLLMCHCPKDQEPEIAKQIKSVVDSLVSTAYGKEKEIKALDSDFRHKAGGTEFSFPSLVDDEEVLVHPNLNLEQPNESDENESDESVEKFDDSNESQDFTILKVINDVGKELDYSKLCKKVLDRVGNDPELLKLVELKFDGYYKAREIAAVSDFSAKDVYRLEKRLNTRLKGLSFANYI